MIKLARAPKQNLGAPPTAKDIAIARMRVHEIAGRVNLRDAMFLRRVAKMLALVPVVENEQ